MSLLPYFKWYPADVQTSASYKLMTLAERGLYRDCLDMAWINDGLPADPDRIVRLLGIEREEFDRLWPAVSGMFHQTKGKLRNSRQEEERERARHLSESNRRAGNANARRIRESNDTPEKRECSTNDTRDREQNDAIRAYDYNYESKKKNSLREFPTFEKDLHEAWGWFKSKYPGELHEEHDCQIFMSVIQTFEDIAILRKNLPLWMESDKWKDGYHNTAENFLRKGIFRDAPKAREPDEAVRLPMGWTAEQYQREKEKWK